MAPSLSLHLCEVGIELQFPHWQTEQERCKTPGVRVGPTLAAALAFLPRGRQPEGGFQNPEGKGQGRSPQGRQQDWIPGKPAFLLRT